jgi:hypothetical protein
MHILELPTEVLEIIVSYLSLSLYKRVCRELSKISVDISLLLEKKYDYDLSMVIGNHDWDAALLILSRQKCVPPGDVNSVPLSVIHDLQRTHGVDISKYIDEHSLPPAYGWKGDREGTSIQTLLYHRKYHLCSLYIGKFGRGKRDRLSRGIDRIVRENDREGIEYLRSASLFKRTLSEFLIYYSIPELSDHIPLGDLPPFLLGEVCNVLYRKRKTDLLSKVFDNCIRRDIPVIPGLCVRLQREYKDRRFQNIIFSMSETAFSNPDVSFCMKLASMINMKK